MSQFFSFCRYEWLKKEIISRGGRVDNIEVR